MVKRTNVLKLSQSLTLPDWANKYSEDHGILTVAARILRDTLDIDEAAHNSIELAGADPDLSEIGSRKARKAAGEVQLELLAKVKSEAERVITKAVNDARAKATKEKSPVETMIEETRAREIRDLLLQSVGEDSLKLKMAISDAQARDDSITIDAILNAPSVSPLAGMIDRDALKELRNGMVDASLGEETVALVQAEADLFQRIQWAKERITKTAGLDADDDGFRKVSGGLAGSDADGETA